MTTKNKKVADRDLMSYLDGELDDEARARVDEALATDAEMRDKLTGLRLVGELVRESVDADDRGTEISLGIADAVMGKLDEPVVEDDKVVPLKKPDLAGEAANDNSRTIWTLAAAAAAVAAGLFIWSNMGGGSEQAVASRPEVTEAPDVAPSPEAEGAPTPAPETIGAAPTEDDEDEVEIASVEFGAAQTGSLFRVGDKNTGTATAVVWVTSLGDEE